MMDKTTSLDTRSISVLKQKSILKYNKFIISLQVKMRNQLILTPDTAQPCWKLENSIYFEFSQQLVRALLTYATYLTATKIYNSKTTRASTKNETTK